MFTSETTPRLEYIYQLNACLLVCEKRLGIKAVSGSQQNLTFYYVSICVHNFGHISQNKHVSSQI